MSDVIRDGTYGVKIIKNHKATVIAFGHFVFEFGKLHFTKEKKLVLPFILDGSDFKNPNQITISLDRQKAQMLRNHLDEYIEHFDKAKEKTRHV